MGVDPRVLIKKAKKATFLKMGGVHHRSGFGAVWTKVKSIRRNIKKWETNEAWRMEQAQKGYVKEIQGPVLFRDHPEGTPREDLVPHAWIPADGQDKVDREWLPNETQFRELLFTCAMQDINGEDPEFRKRAPVVWGFLLHDADFVAKFLVDCLRGDFTRLPQFLKMPAYDSGASGSVASAAPKHKTQAEDRHRPPTEAEGEALSKEEWVKEMLTQTSQRVDAVCPYIAAEFGEEAMEVGTLGTFSEAQFSSAAQSDDDSLPDFGP